MNIKNYAKTLEKEYNTAKKEFSNFVLVKSLEEIEKNKISFNELKLEIQNLGYKIELAKNLNSYWKKQWDKSPIFVLFKNDEDL